MEIHNHFRACYWVTCMNDSFLCTTFSNRSGSFLSLSGRLLLRISSLRVCRIDHKLPTVTCDQFRTSNEGFTEWNEGVRMHTDRYEETSKMRKLYLKIVCRCASVCTWSVCTCRPSCARHLHPTLFDSKIRDIRFSRLPKFSWCRGKYLMETPASLAAIHCSNAFRSVWPPYTPHPLSQQQSTNLRRTERECRSHHTHHTL